MRLTEEEMNHRRETIIFNAFRLFCNQGIAYVSMLKIAEKSNVGVNTVYRYFGSKENLVLEVFIKLWDSIMAGVEKNVESLPDYSGLTGYEQIRAWIEGFRHLYLFDKDFVLFSYEAKLYLLRHKIKLNKLQQDILMHTIREPCLAALEKGKLDGSIPTVQNSEDLFYAIWGSIRGYVVKIVIYEELYAEDTPWESRYSIMEEGILSALRSGWSASVGKQISEK